jgi:hypothetical protein
MNAHTFEIVKAALRGDSTIAPDERTRLLVVLKNGENKSSTASSTPRLVRRAEAATRLSCSIRLIDKLAASGQLRKRTLPGRSRSCGFLESDLLHLLNGRETA